MEIPVFPEILGLFPEIPGLICIYSKEKESWNNGRSVLESFEARVENVKAIARVV